MIKKTLWIAEDDTVFETEEECREYELTNITIPAIKDDLFVLDYNGKEVEPANLDMSKIWKMVVKTEEAGSFILDELEAQGIVEEGFYGNPGAYWWNDDESHWENVEDTIKKYSGLIEEMMELKGKLEN